MDTISYLYFPHWLRFSGLHGVAGNVAALADGHALCRGTVRLLYADDREKARESLIMEDGSFSFVCIRATPFFRWLLICVEVEA
jgi:hypothetical protein